MNGPFSDSRQRWEFHLIEVKVVFLCAGVVGDMCAQMTAEIRKRGEINAHGVAFRIAAAGHGFKIVDEIGESLIGIEVVEPVETCGLGVGLSLRYNHLRWTKANFVHRNTFRLLIIDIL